MADVCRIGDNSANSQAINPICHVGVFCKSESGQIASFAKTSFAKIFSCISDWQKYLLKMLHRHVLSSTFAILARVSPYLETNLQILVSKLQICTLARCIPPLFF